MMNKPVAIFIFPCFLVTTKSCKDLIFYCPFHKNNKERVYFTIIQWIRIWRQGNSESLTLSLFMASKCSQNSNPTQHEREAVNYSVWEFKEDNELHQIR